MKHFIVLAILLAGCGYVGDPLPPALRIPVAVDDLAAVQRGEEVIIQFRVSLMTTEGLRLERYGEADLRIGAEGVQPFHQPTWESFAHPIPLEPPEEPGLIRVETPAADWAGREVLIGLRLANERGRWSEWSNLMRLEVVRPLERPTGIVAKSVRDGVELRWASPGERPGQSYRVFRRQEDSSMVSLVGQTNDTVWLDAGAGFGTSYEYQVQALVSAGQRMAESELSDPVAIVPEDRFAPLAPKTVRAVAGLDSIELTWDRVTADDLAAYRVYRATGDAPETRVGEEVTVPGYSDRAVRSGERYRYRVTAVDRLGNESAPSEAVEQTAP